MGTCPGIDQLPDVLQQRDRKSLLQVIKFCGKEKDLLSARRIHGKVLQKKLFLQDIYVNNALLSMYAKCGAVSEARNVFDKLHVRNVVSWNALITAYVRNGLDDKALECFQQMQDQGFSPNAVTFTCILKVCGNMESLQMGEEIHAEINKQGLSSKDLVLGNTLIDMYARCGDLTKAKDVFEGFRSRDVLAWNALISAYAQSGLGDDALNGIKQMLDQGISPNVATFTSILKACSKKGMLKVGERVHLEVSKRGLFGKEATLDNAVIDMYAKFALLEKAKELFDALPERDVVAWNTLISGFVQHGLSHEALNQFSKMQEEGTAPNSMTYICILKACGSIGSLKVGEMVHMEVKQQGLLLQRNVILGTTLVDMYAKCGELGKAQEVFEELPDRNVVSWSALIAGYTRNGLAHEALNCFRRMQDEGISPNVVTFICILKACGSTASLQIGEEIYAEVRKQGLLGKDVVLGTALIDMYANCGALRKAQQIFDKILSRNVVCWNSLISGYTEHKQVAEALSCFRQMEQEGVSPDAVTFICVLKACGSIGCLDMGKEIHAKISTQGLLHKDILLSTTLVDMYAKCGMLEKARDVFEGFPVHNVVSWNALITGYAQHGFGEEVIACFKQMQDEGVTPNAVTFISVLKACGGIGASKMGEEIHDKIREQRLLEKDIVLGTMLVDMYAKCGMLEKASEVFEQLPVQDVVSWNALVAGYAQHGFHDEAFESFRKMQNKGILPDSASFVCILKACNSVEMVDKIHADIKDCRLLEKNTVLGSTLVDMYAKCGTVGKAQEVFDELPVRDVVCWNTLITCYTQHGSFDEAVEIFQKMQDEGVRPDLVTFVCVLKACSNIGSLGLGADIHVKAIKQGLLCKSIVLGNTLVDMYAKCCALEKAKVVFDELPTKDVVSWNALITGYAQLGDTRKVLGCFRKMTSEGVLPNVITFLVLLTSCSHAGLVQEGQTVFDAMDASYCLPPTLEHLACMVDLFGRTRHFEKALILIENVPFPDRLPIWLAFLGACSKWANVELGRWAFDEATKLDENCASAYICLGNLMAAAGMHGQQQILGGLEHRR